MAKKDNTTKKKMGRPTKYTKKLGDNMCFRLASGESLNSICRDEKMPHKVTVMRWLLSESDVYKDFRNQYAFARQIQYELMADELMDIADDGTNDWMEKFDRDGEKIGWILNGEHVQRSKLRTETRKWFMSKCLPKFKDKPDQNDASADLAEALKSIADKLPD